jgi:hypothetical protein
VEAKHSTIQIDGETYETVAYLNNCAGLWTASLRSGNRVISSGAGYSPEEAVSVAAERLQLATSSARPA